MLMRVFPIFIQVETLEEREDNDGKGMLLSTMVNGSKELLEVIVIDWEDQKAMKNSQLGSWPSLNGSVKVGVHMNEGKMPHIVTRPSPCCRGGLGICSKKKRYPPQSEVGH